jgi:mRNA interferase HigB
LHIISRKALKAAIPLDSWYRTAKSADWRSLEDVRKTYPSADAVAGGDHTYTVFNIGGNNFRLVTRVTYKTHRVFIKHVLTHAEYDKGDWKK